MISLKEKLNRLPPDKIADLELITGKIVETGLAELIVLYGSHARGDFEDENIVTVEGLRGQPGYQLLRRSDYDILVVIDQPDEEWEIDETFSGSSRPITIGRSELTICEEVRRLGLHAQVIVEQIGEINRRLKDKQYFYSDIKREGIVLYDTEKCRLAELPKEITPTVRRKYAEDYFEGGYGEAKSFWRQAQHAQDDNDYRMAAFDLEQVCEVCYKCILLVYTHYAPHEHDLYELRAEAEKCEPLLKEVFPLQTKDQRDSFKKLNLCYIGARYIMGFSVEKDEIDRWRPEVEKLLSVTEQTCKIKIEALKQMED